MSQSLSRQTLILLNSLLEELPCLSELIASMAEVESVSTMSFRTHILFKLSLFLG